MVSGPPPKRIRHVSIFKSQMIKDGWPQVAAHLKDTVIYTPSGGVAVPRVGVFQEIEGIVKAEDPGVLLARRATLKLNDELEGISLTPQRGDVVTVDGEDWQYAGHKTQNGIHTIMFSIAVVSEYDSGVDFS